MTDLYTASWKTVLEIQDPPVVSGMVVTRMKAPDGHVMFHPVFRPDSANPDIGVTNIEADTTNNSVITEPIDFEHGFCRRVRVEHVADEGGRFYASNKAPETEPPQMAVAVAGTVTMPYLTVQETPDEQEPQLGDMVAFANRRPNTGGQWVSLLRRSGVVA